MKNGSRWFVVAACALMAGASRPLLAEDGYELWLRYRAISDPQLLARYRSAITHLVIAERSPTLRAVREELERGVEGLLAAELQVTDVARRDGALIVGTPASSRAIAQLGLDSVLRVLGPDGFVIREVRMPAGGRRAIVVASSSDVGALYGAFHLLRLMQTQQPIAGIEVASAPRIRLRLLNHWDNLNRSVERGYAGQSLWEWEQLPDSLSSRYRDYARANASLGINGTVLTNVNANAQVLTAPYLDKVARLANVFRPYGIRVYLTARFSAPVEIGGLRTADPRDSAVARWWKTKTDEIYRVVPDFGGFLVKANSEGQPGPQDYGRTHADGANMLADAVAPHGGIVMWRAFVYSNTVPVDRVKQAYDEFKPLDGTFRENVLIQVKNGALDFQPREPFHPLFGAMPKTSLMVEFQITKEYLGQDTHLAYLGPYFEEVLDADTYASGAGSTVAKVVDGSVPGYARTAIAGVSNVGTDRNWAGSHFNPANWYAYGRLAWNPQLSAAGIADEWIRMTFTNDAAIVARIRHLMMISREAVVDYMTPLGLAHIMATGHHYGPGPWADAGRPDWTPSYYHRADTLGVGFDRTSRGSNAVEQYFPDVRRRFESRATTPDELLLWFHHVRWTDTLSSGRTLWDELVKHYNAGVDSVRAMQRGWASVERAIDAERFRDVRDFLAIQLAEARWWRDAAVQYFATFSRLPIPPGYEPPAHPLSYYRSLRCPPDPRRPRCPAVY